MITQEDLQWLIFGLWVFTYSVRSLVWYYRWWWDLWQRRMVWERARRTP